MLRNIHHAFFSSVIVWIFVNNKQQFIIFSPLPLKPETIPRCRPLPRAPTFIIKWQSTWETPRTIRITRVRTCLVAIHVQLWIFYCIQRRECVTGGDWRPHMLKVSVAFDSKIEYSIAFILYSLILNLVGLLCYLTLQELQIYRPCTHSIYSVNCMNAYIYGIFS